MANPNKANKANVGSNTMADAIVAAIGTETAAVETAVPVVVPARDVDAEITVGVLRPEPTSYAPFDLLTFAAIEKAAPYAGPKQTSIGLATVTARVAGTKIALVFRVGLSWDNATPSEQRAYIQIPGHGRMNWKTDGIVSTDPIADSALSAYLDQVAEYAVEYYARYQARLAEEAAKAARESGEVAQTQAPVSRKTFNIALPPARSK